MIIFNRKYSRLSVDRSNLFDRCLVSSLTERLPITIVQKETIKERLSVEEEKKQYRVSFGANCFVRNEQAGDDVKNYKKLKEKRWRI